MGNNFVGQIHTAINHSASINYINNAVGFSNFCNGFADSGTNRIQQGSLFFINLLREGDFKPEVATAYVKEFKEAINSL